MSSESSVIIRRAQSLLTALSMSLSLAPITLQMLAAPASARVSRGHSHLIAAKSTESAKENSKDESADDNKSAKSKEKKAEEKKSDEKKPNDKKAKAKDKKEEKASAREDKASAKENKASLKEDKAKADDEKETKTAKKGLFGHRKEDEEIKVEKAEKTETKKKEIVKVKSIAAPAAALTKESEKKAEVREEKALLFEPDSALISVLKDLSRTLKEPEEQNKIEDANQRMIVGLASDVLNKALNDPKLVFNRILAKEQEYKARTRLTAEAWSSGDVEVNDRFHGSLSTVWAKRIDGLVTVTIAGDCHDRKAKDGNDIGEFLVVITAKSPVETGFDIQSQANVNFWMGKLSNIAVEADCIAKQAAADAEKGDESQDRERKIETDKKSEAEQQKKKSIAALPPLLTNRYRSYYELMIVQDDRRRLIAQQLADMDPSFQLEEAAKKEAVKKAVGKTDSVSEAANESEGEDDETDKRTKASCREGAAPAVGDEKKESAAEAKVERELTIPDKVTTASQDDKKVAETELKSNSGKEFKGDQKAESKTIEEKLTNDGQKRTSTDRVLASEKVDKVEKIEKIRRSDKSENEDESAKVIVHTKPANANSSNTNSVNSNSNVSSTQTADAGRRLDSSTNSLTAGTVSGSSATNLAMVISPSLNPNLSTRLTNGAGVSNNFSNQNTSTRPHGKQGNETAYAGAAASMERVTGLELPALKQPKNFTMLMPDRALAGQPLTVAFVDDQQNPESNVELSFNGVTLSTDQNGQAQYMIPEDETPGRSLNIALLSRPYEMPSVVEVLQPLATPESPQAPKVDKASHLVSRRSNLIIDGHNFDGVAQNNRVIIDGLIEASIAASSPVQLKVNLPKDLKPGPHSLCVSTEGMRSNPIGFELAQLEVACDANSNKVTVKVVGTTSKVNVKLVNLSPDLIKMTRGDDTKLLSSGGPDNTASVSVQRIKKGATRVEAWIEL